MSSMPIEIPARVASAKPELFQLIQRGNRNCGAGDLIAAPNDVAELFLARCFVEETKFFRPNLIKNDATGCCLDYVAVGISKDSLLARDRGF